MISFLKKYIWDKIKKSTTKKHEKTIDQNTIDQNTIEENTIEIEQSQTITASKNKWLYPTDKFGKLEKNMVYESRVYESGIKENKSESDDFIIITP